MRKLISSTWTWLIIQTLFNVSISSFTYAEGLGEIIDIGKYRSRSVLPDPYEKPCPDTPVKLLHLEGNLYRHTIGSPAFYSGLVLITQEGALIIDPARTCTALKLKEMIDEKFHVPVKYVVYTHGHFDHIGGGQVFQNAGAQVVAQKNALEPIIGERLPTALPNIVFDQEMALNIGGESVLLHHAPPSHSDSMTFVYFPKYKALQCTDICGSDSLPYGELPDFYYDGWVEALTWIQRLDIRWIDDGHHQLATKEQQLLQLRYLQELHTQVLDLVRGGESWEQIYHDIKFKDVYKKWTDFESYHLSNTRGMYEWISLHRRGDW